MKDTMVTDAEKTIEAQPEPVWEPLPRQKPALVVINAVINKKPAPVFHRQLFAASMLELTDVDRARRKWATLISVTLQSLVIGILIMIPLMFPEVLPVRQLVTFLAAPPPPPPPPPPAAPIVARTHVVSQFIEGQLTVPSRIPAKIQMLKEDAVPISGGVEGGVVGGVPGGQLGGVLGGLVSTPVRATALPAAPPVVPQRIAISQGVSEGLLLTKVNPQYPILALRAHVEGTVKLRAIISKQGTIENLVLIDGHPLLVPAAMEAVKSWRYRPYLLSGEPVEVDTSIFVNFHFGQ